MFSIDVSNFKGFLKNFPEQIIAGKKIFDNARIKIRTEAVDKIIYLGMGGSAIAGDVLAEVLFDKLSIPMQVVRGYECPAYCDNKTLVIVSSYSGNTEETLSSLEQARKNSTRIIAVTSGGELHKLAKKNKWKLIKLPEGLPPRQAFGYLFFPALYLVNNFVDEPVTAGQLEKLIMHVQSQILRSDEVSAEGKSLPREIAFKLHNKIPIIYAVEPYFKSIAFRWRTQINENAKSLAFHHVLPEMNHNEIVGWDINERLTRDLIVVILESNVYPPRINTRIQLTKKILRDKGVEIVEVYATGDTILDNAISLICMSDWVSYYLALLYEKDPLTILNIDYFKSELKKIKSN
jgi:glucose/mannose-6-phosphate isomerase